MKGVAIGIDLGTTNSVMAVVDESGIVQVIPTQSGEKLTPSVISHQARALGTGLLVGQAALNNAMRAPGETIVAVKRLMGREFDEPAVEQVGRSFTYKPMPAENPADPGVYLKLGDRLYAPHDLSGLILHHLREAAERHLKQPVTHAVITVPAYFEERQRAATRLAAEQAGLKVKKIIDEPTAAAVAYADTGPVSGRVLVYDLGGGTFDLSIIQWVEDQYQVVGIGGDNWLGGNDLDQLLVDRLVAHIADERGIDPSHDMRFLTLARRAAEQARVALSDLSEFAIVIPGATRDPSGGLIDVDEPLTREDVEQMIAPFVDRTIALLTDLVVRSNLRPNDFDHVLLIGGTTATPLIQRRLAELFGASRVHRSANAMYGVAMGAALLAARLRGAECTQCGRVNPDEAERCAFCSAMLAAVPVTGNLVLNEVSARSLGIGCKGDDYAVVIPRGTVYPLHTPMRRTFYPSMDMQRAIYVPIYEGDAQPASANQLQGVIAEPIDQPMAMGTPIIVTFDYDADRVLSVTVQPEGQRLIRASLNRVRPAVVSEIQFAPQHDRPAWTLDLERAYRLAERFLSSCADLLGATQVDRLYDAVDDARRALAMNDSLRGGALIERLHRAVFQAGLANQVFLAEELAGRLPGELGERFAALAYSIRDGVHRGDQAAVAAGRAELDQLLSTVTSLPQQPPGDG